MQRQYLISDTQVRIIKKELEHLKSNCISTPETEAGYKQIVGMLSTLKGA